MIIRKPSTADGSWQIAVLDQHRGVHMYEAGSSSTLYDWMAAQDDTAFFTDRAEWAEVVQAVAELGIVHVETEFDCDYVVWQNNIRFHTPGDPPVPKGSVVRYHGRSQAHGLYTVTGHSEPAATIPAVIREENYPDGVAYDLWPMGVERKFANRDRAVYQVRRRSFTALSQP